MKFAKSFVMIATLAVACSNLVAHASADCQAHPRNEQIGEQTFANALKKVGFKIESFETSGNCYELYGKSPKGHEVEIYFDTKTGKIVKMEKD